MIFLPVCMGSLELVLKLLHCAEETLFLGYKSRARDGSYNNSATW